MSANEKRIKALFYDSKTTLFDWGTKWVEASRRILVKYKREDIDPAEFKKVWNFYHTYENHKSAFGAYVPFQIYNATALMHAFEHYSIKGSRDDVLFMQELWDEVLPFSDVVPELKKQQQLVKVFIFSNIETKYLDMLVSKLDGFKPDFVGDMEQAQCSKPSPRAYNWVLKHVGLKPDEVLYCARPQWDVQGAIAAGINKAVWLNRGGEVLDGVKPDYIVEDMRGVTEAVRANL